MEINDNGGGGGGTNFRSMSHQHMLEWLDAASSFYVKEAADRLSSAAAEMRDIAQQLRFRPERVNWKGEAPTALVEWGASLAKSTFSLADYSDNAATWMNEASNAIATAQSAIPRYTSHAEAKENLEAARKYHNDPDSQTIARNAQSSMAASEEAKAIAAKEEANRQAAAAEMEKLSQAYSWSEDRMKNGATPPTFPPPPSEYKPPPSLRKRDQYSSEYIYPNGSSGFAAEPGAGAAPSQGGSSAMGVGAVSPAADSTLSTRQARPEVPADLGIDSVGTLPPTTTTPSPTSNGQPPLGRPDGGVTLPAIGGTGVLPPPVSGGTTGGASPGGSRSQSGLGGRSGLGHTGPLGGTAREGISGGRAVPQASGRAATGIPRGTVIGNEHGTGTGRAPMGHGMSGGQMGSGGGQSGISGGRRLAVESGGVVGGRSQQPGTASGRPFTPGGSGLVRGGTQGDAARGAGQMGRGGMISGGTRGSDSRRDENNGERPDYLVEDEETWQQGGRRIAPPVID
ncbi:immunity 70 family protein [Streptomyces sp. NBC_01216]|uniref:hypothetical protein n=1 Tax=Streptomyces sp. NBC_01216 TaxID=2903778 RepID=UPI002E15E898|nr:immunity 70 family protein [Streptomyces sp. NBC_01216]